MQIIEIKTQWMNATVEWSRERTKISEYEDSTQKLPNLNNMKKID